ncbi:MAG: hypothetical protein OEZ16_08710, partial [Chromatiales bacterium]|nr:hypothetical protein [Chromatiales bacterium]
LALNPDYAYAHYQRACANSTLGHLEQAHEELQLAIALSSTYIEEARNDMGLANLRDSGRLDEMLDNDGTKS